MLLRMHFTFCVFFHMIMALDHVYNKLDFLKILTLLIWYENDDTRIMFLN